MSVGTTKDLREQVKHYIDTADEKTVKMIYAMLEVDADDNWWSTLPDNIIEDINLSLKQANSGDVIPHSEVMQKLSPWFTK